MADDRSGENPWMDGADGSTERERITDRPICELIGGPFDGQHFHFPDHKAILVMSRDDGAIIRYERDGYTTRFVYRSTERKTPPKPKRGKRKPPGSTPNY